MCSKVPSFDAVPQLLASILGRLESLEMKIDSLQSVKQSQEDVWFSLKDLCNYLPNHPAEQTVYGWTSNHTIPFHKNGKSITFLKSEIDDWMKVGIRKSSADLMAEAQTFVANNPKSRKEVSRYYGR